MNQELIDQLLSLKPFLEAHDYATEPIDEAVAELARKASVGTGALGELIERLEPCPFCGSEKVSRTSDVRLFIRCAKCGARGPAISYVDDHVPNDADWAKAIAAWNTRDQSQSARIAELREGLRLFPEAFDVLTRQEMRDAKGNWRSLIDQQTKVLADLRASLIKDSTSVTG